MKVVSRFDDNFIGRYDDKLLVKYSFVMNLGNEKHEVKGVKTLKLFRSWFRLSCNWHYKYCSQKRELLYGVVEFASGEKWIWQNKNRVYRGGWQLAISEEFATMKREKKMMEIEKKRQELKEQKEIEESRKYWQNVVDELFDI